MNVISTANKNILQILARMNVSDQCSRLMLYVIELYVLDGKLLFNLLTREMVLLSEEEWQNRFENEYLKKHWFVVPEDCNDKEYADLVRWVLDNKKSKNQPITGYTIFPTTDCNARCFYCFELGCSRIPMTEETALKVVDYIVRHCSSEKVKLNWFGGEPLFNRSVIDTICRGLQKKEIEFSSRAISNGYLFDIETVRNAVKNWNLKKVQITLDGTEQVYNRVKAYIYHQGNPYETVMENIGHLLNAGVAVSIRLNLGMHNADNLLELVGELADRFLDKKGLSVYAYHLFDGNKPLADTHSYEEWEVRDAAMCQLNEKIRQHGLASLGGIRKEPKINHCMADSGNAVTILPNGEIGLCEHFSESEFIGHIDREGFDQIIVNSWKERIAEIPECATCFYYPECLQLKKCPNTNVCFEQWRRNHRRQTEQRMLNEYRKWKTKSEPDENTDADIC